MRNLTGIEKKVQEFAERTGIPSNNIFWGDLDIVCSDLLDTITAHVDKHKVMHYVDLQNTLDEHTKKFKNPENSAIRAIVCEDLKTFGYSINEYQVWKS